MLTFIIQNYLQFYVLIQTSKLKKSGLLRKRNHKEFNAEKQTQQRNPKRNEIKVENALKEFKTNSEINNRQILSILAKAFFKRIATVARYGDYTIDVLHLYKLIFRIVII